MARIQTMWLATEKHAGHRATRSHGTIDLIGFAMGLVTGIVHELQDGG